jgi:hypothetical protein
VRGSSKKPIELMVSLKADINEALDIVKLLIVLKEPRLPE